MTSFFLPRSKGGFVTLGYTAGWEISGLLPERVAYRIDNIAANRIAANPAITRQLHKNLAHVMDCPPEEVPQGFIWASMRFYLRYWAGAFRLPSIVSLELADTTESTSDGLERVAEALEAGDSIVIPLSYSGNWDMVGMRLVSRHGRFSTVVERLKPEVLYDASVEYHESFGFHILPPAGGKPVMPGFQK